MPTLTYRDIPWASGPLPKSFPDLRGLTDLECIVLRESPESVAHWLLDLLIDQRETREVLSEALEALHAANEQRQRLTAQNRSLQGEIRQLMGVEPDGR